MNHKSFTLIFICVMIGFCFAGDIKQNCQTLELKKGEKWWGGAVVHAPQMPIGEKIYNVELYGDKTGNQSQPLFISNFGRYIWSEEPIYAKFDGHSLFVSSSGNVITGRAGNTLRDAFLGVSKKYFPPSGKIPEPLLFTKPQYNTWIELMYDQNQEDILKYAHAIIDNGFPPGVLMIDDNWQEDYGVWEFKAEKFPNPKAMMEELHSLGFKVMLWVCPFVSPDSRVYRELRDKNLLIQEAAAPQWTAIIRWWNGASGLLDLTNPKAEEWFIGVLKSLQNKYGVDGFKLDAGDANFYDGEFKFYKDVHPNHHSELFAQIGLQFPLNEYRACWKMAGQPLAQRLRDKANNWNDLQKLVPGILSQGLMGYSFTCPDMIGGGEYKSFLNSEHTDQKQVVRSAQTHALMPMMQFSVAPWRILDKKNLEITRKMALLHEEMGEHILELAKESAKTGEPIVRHFEYVFPHQGFSEINDQFMLGNDILVAPVVEEDAKSRVVQFPKGVWLGDDGSKVIGPKKLEIKADIERLPWYRLQKPVNRKVK